MLFLDQDRKIWNKNDYWHWLDKKTLLNQKQISSPHFSLFFHCLSVVSVSYWSLIKGITLRICMFCPNSVLLNLLCVYAGLAHWAYPSFFEVWTVSRLNTVCWWWLCAWVVVKSTWCIDSFSMCAWGPVEIGLKARPDITVPVDWA